MRTSAVVLSGLLLACGDDGGGPGGNGSGSGQRRLKSSIGLDLSRVIGFAITGTSGSPRVAPHADDAGPCMPSTLYAVQDDGSMVVTTVTESIDGNDASICGSSMMTEQASAVFDTPKYVVIKYQSGIHLSTPEGGRSCPFVVMRKQTGALYCAGDSSLGGLPGRVEGMNDKLYLGPQALLRLDMSVEPPTLVMVNDTAETVNTFHANSVDDALAGGSFGVRVFKANGGLMNISAEAEACQWLAPDGTFYYGHQVNGTPQRPSRLILEQLAAGTYAASVKGVVTPPNSMSAMLPQCNIALATSTQAYSWTSGTGQTPALVELLKTGPGVCYKKFQSMPSGACDVDADCDATACAPGMCGGGMCCVGGSLDSGSCTTVADCPGTCITAGTAHPVSGITMIRNAVGQGSKIFVQGTDAAGNGAVIEVAVPGFAQTTRLAPGEYTLTATSISKNGELTFAGLRNSDGARVIGNCNPACTVLNASAPQVSFLQRIN